jgi:hypothetical protein
MTSGIQEKIETRNSTGDVAFDYAWKYFEYHAAQRLQMIRFYLTAIIAIGTGIGFLYKESDFALATLMSIFGAAITLIFWRLDQRVADLIKHAERALKLEESRLARETENNAMKIVEAADGNLRIFPYTYRQNFLVMFGLVVVVFLVLAYLSGKQISWNS